MVKKKEAPIRAALYLRVSTQDQIENYSIEIQRERMEALCKSKGWVVGDEFVDGGYSGSNLDRPGLQVMLSRLDEFDAVIVHKLDRLSRSQRDTMELIQDHFLENEIHFVSVTETLDTSTPFGLAMIGILAVFAELERGAIAERMRSGLIQRSKEGYRSAGGNHDPSGFTRRPDGDLEPIAEEVEQIQMMFNLYEQFLSITRVQEKLKEMGFPVWRFNRSRQILSNRLYVGDVQFAGIYYKGRHEAIISEEQFDRVQDLLARHRGHNAHKAKESLFSGLISCPLCGEKYLSYSYRVKNKTRGDYYVRAYICRARRFPVEHDEKCFNKTWKHDDLQAIVFNEIHNLSGTKKLVGGSTTKTNYDLMLKRHDEKIERLVDLYTDGSVKKAILDQRLEKLNVEKENLVRKKSESQKVVENTISQEDLDDYVIALEEEPDFSIRRAVIEKLIKRIVIKDTAVKIEWNL